MSGKNIRKFLPFSIACLAVVSINGIGLYAYFVCGARNYPDERLSFLKLGCWWLLYWHLRRLWISFKHPTRLPRDLVVAELKGAFIGLTRYQKARKTASPQNRSRDC